MYLKFKVPFKLIVIPSGKFIARSRYDHEISFNTHKLYKVSFYHKINKRVNDGKCNYELNWKQDECKLGILAKKILDKFDCTAPWLLNFSR